MNEHRAPQYCRQEQMLSRSGPTAYSAREVNISPDTRQHSVLHGSGGCLCWVTWHQNSNVCWGQQALPGDWKGHPLTRGGDGLQILTSLGPVTDVQGP